MNREPDKRALQQEALAFLRQRHGLILATRSAEGSAEAGYAPFIADDQGNPCIYVSELAGHTRNLLRQPEVSVLLIEDEAEARNPFARRRLTLSCRAEWIEPGSEIHARLLDRMEQRFGNTVSLLRGLGDFHLLRLAVDRGSYVRGFGQAYSVAGPGLEITGPKRGR